MDGHSPSEQELANARRERARELVRRSRRTTRRRGRTRDRRSDGAPSTRARAARRRRRRSRSSSRPSRSCGRPARSRSTSRPRSAPGARAVAAAAARRTARAMLRLPGASGRVQRVLVTDRHLERGVRLPGTQPALVGVGLVTKPTLRCERFDPVDGPAHARERIRETWEPCRAADVRVRRLLPLAKPSASSRTCSGTSQGLRLPRASCRGGARPRR